MKIKIGTVHKDSTAFGNKYYIQIEDTSTNNNSDLENLLYEKVTVVLGNAQVLKESSELYLSAAVDEIPF